MRTVIDIALVLHLVVAAAYWWLSPKGFSIDSSRFWLNSVLPFAAAAAAIVGLWGCTAIVGRLRLSPFYVSQLRGAPWRFRGESCFRRAFASIGCFLFASRPADSRVLAGS
jgi:hypothetical protein